MNKAEPRVLLVRITVVIKPKGSNTWPQDTTRFQFDQTGHSPCLCLDRSGDLQTGGPQVA
jgi:hypothetical protein